MSGISSGAYTSVPANALPMNGTGEAKPQKTGSTRIFLPFSFKKKLEWPNHTSASLSGGSAARSVFFDGSGTSGVRSGYVAVKNFHHAFSRPSRLFAVMISAG